MGKSEDLQKLLEKVFDDCRQGLRQELSTDEYEKRKYDFVFHMTDWRDNLHELAELVANPNRFSTDEATTTLIGFLSHVIPHLTTAGDLLLDGVTNCFAQEKTPVTHDG